MIASLLYITSSRPDIMFSVYLCARYQSNPKKSHLKAMIFDILITQSTMIYFIRNQAHLIYYHIVMLILLDVNLIGRVLVVLVTFWDIH